MIIFMYHYTKINLSLFTLHIALHAMHKKNLTKKLKSA